MSTYERVKKCQEKRYALGLCKRCGKNPFVEGKTLCESCLSNLCKSMKRLKDNREENGLCYLCGKPVEDSKYRSCKSCRDKKNKESKKGKKRKK